MFTDTLKGVCGLSPPNVTFVLITPATPLYDAHQAGFYFLGSWFNKKPLNTAEMIQRFISRGMNIRDRSTAVIAIQRYVLGRRL